MYIFLETYPNNRETGESCPKLKTELNVIKLVSLNLVFRGVNTDKDAKIHPKKRKKKTFPLNGGRKFAAILAGFDDRYQSWFGIDFLNIPSSSSLDLVFWVYQC
jgi:hypothetical protein